MDFQTLIHKRRMVRNFTPEPVAPASLERILEAAQRAPSAGYTQGQNVVVVTRPERRQAIARLCGEERFVARGFDPWISAAPVLLIPCTSEAAYHRRYREPDKVAPGGSEIEWPVPYWHMDVGCTVMLILLAAVDEGLAAGFAGCWDLDALRGLLGIPSEVTPVGVIAVGHPAPDRPSPSLKRGRKPLASFAHREGWQS